MKRQQKRYLFKPIQDDLRKKMVFVVGPGQVGKTTLAQHLLWSSGSKGIYFNWDNYDDRRDLLAKNWSKRNRLLVFDELHKYPGWKNWIKGIWDVEKDNHQVVVTEPAGLDVYNQGGDSLLGRYHYWRLHPFTIDELPAGMSPEDALNRLLTVGGFPEPFLDGDEREARKWRRERYERVIKEDIRDLKPIRMSQQMGLLLDRLRSRVGGLITVSDLARELQVAHNTVKNWLEMLARMYLVFIVRPYTTSIPKAILKTPKVYFFDNADVIRDEGKRFENLVANTLLKRMHYLTDRDGYHYEIRYIKDKEGREVDFAIIKEGQLEELIEVKLSDDKVSQSLLYYADSLNPTKATQIVKNLKRPYDHNRLHVTDPISYFQQVPY